MVKLNRSSSAKRVKAPGKGPGLAGKAVQLEITLRYIQPRIWRSLYVPGDITLPQLHAVIQIVMGWTDSHLHSFRQGNHEYVQPDPDDPGWKQTMSDMIIHDERKHTLGDLIASKGDKFTYTYDFGDDWEHEAVAVKIDPLLERLKRAQCFVGERACPPEDCGSVPGYEELVEALPNPKHPQHKHWREWIGDYDPGRFEVDEVNRLLRRVRV
ncbi:MAG TPA: plasmid pRiA4b ORF-3 family protein [Lacunisphaera sp.]|nr:plasmid pRiA4b ORF-3 family protein [Lacunisphaera sp.]